MSSLKEKAKRLAASAVGVERPKAAQVTTLVVERKAQKFVFARHGRTPNNAALPLIVYRNAIHLEGWDPASILEVLFDAHGWRDSWRDRMYPYNHFHTRTHEVLGIARGSVEALFGGAQGREFKLKAGDVVVVPAGVGHRRLRMSADLLIVGAYPSGGHYDEPRPSEMDRAKADKHIAATPLPEADPVYGAHGPLLTLWRE